MVENFILFILADCRGTETCYKGIALILLSLADGYVYVTTQKFRDRHREKVSITPVAIVFDPFVNLSLRGFGELQHLYQDAGDDQ